MWTKKLAAMLLAAVMIFSTVSPAFTKIIISKDYADRVITRNGKTYIQVTEVKYYEPKYSSPFYKNFMRQMTKLMALRTLADEIIAEAQGLNYWYDNGDEIKIEIDDTYSIIDAISKEARQVGDTEIDEEGNCRVTMEIEVEIQK